MRLCNREELMALPDGVIYFTNDAVGDWAFDNIGVKGTTLFIDGVAVDFVEITLTPYTKLYDMDDESIDHLERFKTLPFEAMSMRNGDYGNTTVKYLVLEKSEVKYFRKLFEAAEKAEQ